MGIFRVPFLMERILSNGLTFSPDAAYLQGIKDMSLRFT